MDNFKDFVGLGIAGNFAMHLEQAGESEDFKDILTADEATPKGIFPFYISTLETNVGEFPLSSSLMELPDTDVNVQAEPEVALRCKMTYKDGKVESITPTHFGAYNDFSIRVAGAKKISHKKNWGKNSKGLSSKMIPLDSFTKGSNIDSWRIASFLKRDGMLMRYGEDAPITGYSYFHEKLLEWIKSQLNSQVDFGPLEPILDYFKLVGFPENIVISIGATRYTHYGETTFLQKGDEFYVVLYDNDIYCKNPIMNKVMSGDLDDSAICALVQVVK